MKKLVAIVLSCLLIFCISAPSVMADTDTVAAAGPTSVASDAAGAAAAGAAGTGLTTGVVVGGVVAVAVIAGIVIAVSDDDDAVAHAHSH